MTFRLIAVSLFALFLVSPACAEEAKPDDTVSFDISAEDWVTTKTAHVTLNVEAAVSATNAGSIRADMTKSVNDAAKSDWRLTNFNRTQDQTGLERWSVSFESRLPEAALNTLPDAVKKASKAGMQITVGGIDFSPTLDETEAASAALRTRLFKSVAEQMTALNATLPGRNYRISQINFGSANMVMAQPRLLKAMAMQGMAAAPSPDDGVQEHAQKMVITAHVTYAALPTTH